MLITVKRQTVRSMRLMKPLGWMFVAFYMGYHTLHGERGLYALMRDKHELSMREQELTETRAARQRMELRVAHLRDGSLDRDLLDEQMRRMMGVMKKGEIVMLGRE